MMVVHEVRLLDAQISSSKSHDYEHEAQRNGFQICWYSQASDFSCNDLRYIRNTHIGFNSVSLFTENIVRTSLSNTALQMSDWSWNRWADK